MPERRLISFEALRADCEHYWWNLAAGPHCFHPRRRRDDIRCMAENCPIWAQLARPAVSVSRLVEIRQLLDTMCARDGADTATLVRDWLDEVIGGDDESR
jgi:hypothetical protein